MYKIFSSAFLMINLFCAFDSNAALVDLIRLPNGAEAKVTLFSEQGQIIENWVGNGNFIQIETDKYYDEVEGYQLFTKSNAAATYTYAGTLYFNDFLPNRHVLITINHRDSRLCALSGNERIDFGDDRLFDFQYRAVNNNAWTNFNIPLQYDQNLVRISNGDVILTDNLVYNFAAGERIIALQNNIGRWSASESVMDYGEERFASSINEILNLTLETAADLQAIRASEGWSDNERRANYLRRLRESTINELKTEINHLQPLSAQFVRRSTIGRLWENELENARRALDGVEYPGTQGNNYNFNDNEGYNLNRQIIYCGDMLVKVYKIIKTYPFPDQNAEERANTRRNMIRTLIINLGYCIEDDGHRVCPKGKLKRLILALQGYIPNIGLDPINENDVANVEELITDFKLELEREIAGSDSLANLAYRDFDEYTDTQEHLDDLLKEFNIFFENKRSALKNLAKTRYNNHPAQKIKLREIFENRIFKEWKDVTADVMREFNENNPPLPLDFNPLTYLQLNPDLMNHANTLASEEDKVEFAKYHYTRYGKAKGREYLVTLPADFNPEMYLMLNPDLRDAAESLDSTDKKRAFAKYHYLNHGKAKGREYVVTLPADFNPEMYLMLNPDLRDAAESLDSTDKKRAFATDHYLNHGKIKGRRYK